MVICLINEHKKTRLFGGGFVFRFEFYIQFPPPDVAGIIITTTIIIAVIMEVMLLTLLFCMKDVILQI
ncbi:MAG: hypothetical protein DI535_18575 [Citrobacter freundii]|nr:MAG: hypothetical protein DI535_18575 [Citrobacter freundii]